MTIATFESIMVSALSPVPGGDGRAVQSGNPSITVGSLWWMPTVVISGDDPKRRRPIVVVQVRYGLVQVITRTSDVRVKGVLHPADDSLGLSKQGVFSMRHLRSIEEQHFGGSTVEYLGVLGEPYLRQVIEMWES